MNKLLQNFQNLLKEMFNPDLPENAPHLHIINYVPDNFKDTFAPLCFNDIAHVTETSTRNADTIAGHTLIEKECNDLIMIPADHLSYQQISDIQNNIPAENAKGVFFVTSEKLQSKIVPTQKIPTIRYNDLAKTNLDWDAIVEQRIQNQFDKKKTLRFAL